MKMSKAKKIFTNVRVILVLVAIVLALIALSPNPFRKGAAIRSVAYNTSAYNAGIKSAAPSTAPMSREVIVKVNNDLIANSDDYYYALRKIETGMPVRITTTKATYTVLSPESKISDAAGIESVDLGIKVYDAPTSNIRKGLDLQGGTRTILQPEEAATAEQISMTIDSMNQRLNQYGLSDVVVKQVSDLSGKKYILVEIAGAYEEEVRQLVAKQGKFEAKVGNKTVFMGGNDIINVCRTADCSGIDTTVGCQRSSSDGKWYCRFSFSISLSPAAAKRQYDAILNLSTIPSTDATQVYLNETLDLYLDDQMMDSLQIGADLQKNLVTDVAISGSGQGNTKEEAMTTSLASMKRLQTVLITGSLPIKLNIVKTDAISPLLGAKFLKNTSVVFLVAILMVSLVLFMFYKKIKVAGMIMVTGLIEILLTVGFLTSIGWNMDMSAIAGLIAAIGSNVDDQIVMTDEQVQAGKTENEKKQISWKDRIKGAFYIIIGNYLTSVASVLPLLFAGAGLLKGFAITSIVGLTLGVLLTRPAYAQVLEILLRDD
jgi:preprotein translocase subunit SecD